MSVGIHLTSSGSWGLFNKAIQESNPSAFMYKNEKHAAYYGKKFCELLKCSKSSYRAEQLDSHKRGLHPSTAPTALRLAYELAATSSRPGENDFLSEDELSIFLQETSCNLPCVQQAPIDAVNEAWNKAASSVWTWIEANLDHPIDGILQWTPTVDGTIITQEPLAAMQSGHYADVPVLLVRWVGACFWLVASFSFV